MWYEACLVIQKKGHVQGERKKKKKKKKSNWSHRQAYVQLHMDIFVQKLCPIFIFSFLSILERTVFGGSNDKTPESYYLFSFLPTQPNIFLKVFLPIFFLKVFIHPISPSNKHTLNVIQRRVQEKVVLCCNCKEGK